MAQPPNGWEVVDDESQWEVVPDAPPDPYAGDKWSDLPGNILPSVGRLIGGAVSGVASLPGLALDLMDPRPIHNQTQMAVGKALSQPVETAKAIGSAVGDKYGSGAALKHSLITDPAGVAADASVLLGGTGAALRGAGTVAKIPGLVRAGQMASTVGRGMDPVLGATKVALAGGGLVRPSAETFQRLGTRAMASATKFPDTLLRANVENPNAIMAELKIIPTPQVSKRLAARGYQGIEGNKDTLKDLSKQARGIIRANQMTGERVDPARVVHQLNRERGRTHMSRAFPGEHDAAFTAKTEEFWNANSKPSMVEQPLVSPVQTSTGAGIAQPSRGTLSATMEAPSAPLARRTGTGWGAEPPQSAAVPMLEPPAATTSGMTPVAPTTGVDTSLRGVESNAGFPVRPQTQAVSKMVEGPRVPLPIGLKRAQRMIENLNKDLPHGKKNPLGGETPPTPSQDVDFATAKALRRELDTAAPGFYDVQKQRARRLSVAKGLTRTANREGNRDLFGGVRGMYGAGITAGLIASGAPASAAIGGTVVPIIANASPFKAVQAARLYHMDKTLTGFGQAARTGATATTRTGVASDALRQALLDAMHKTTEQP